MLFRRKSVRLRRGVTLILAMVLVVIFATLAVSMAGLSARNLQMAPNQHKVNAALYAAQSGLECAKYFVSTLTLFKTQYNEVSADEANVVWATLKSNIQIDGQNPRVESFSDGYGSGEQVITSGIDFGNAGVDFTIRFYRYASEPCVIRVESTGTSNGITRRIGTSMDITKDSRLLTYAIAGRGRMWLTGDTTIHGDVFSTWNYPNVSPFNTTGETAILEKVNTVVTKTELGSHSYQLETLDGNGNPRFTVGQTVYGEDGNPLPGTVGTVNDQLYMTDIDGNLVYDEEGD